MLELKKYWPEYLKGGEGSFNHLKLEIEKAKKYSARLMDESKLTGSINPTTEVHELVNFLQNIKTR
ncbi:hypothetical protein D3C80_1761070 [compost metagenome]